MWNKYSTAFDFNQDGYIDYKDEGILQGDFKSNGQKQPVKYLNISTDNYKSISGYVEQMKNELLAKLGEKYTMEEGKYHIYNITLTEEMTMSEFVEMIKEFTEKDTEIIVDIVYIGDEELGYNKTKDTVIQANDGMDLRYGFSKTKSEIYFTFLYSE